jgi:phage N-6-adenine-methyltransferase
MAQRCAYRDCANEVRQPMTGRRRRYCSDRCRLADWRRKQRAPPARVVMSSSQSVEFPTDPQVFAALSERYGPFNLDAAATAENAKCARYFTAADDGLAQTWTGRVWLNPPYGREVGKWVKKAWESAQSSAELVVCLVPARTDTRWWHEYAVRGEVEFVRGRLRFGRPTVAPFPSAVIVFRCETTETKHRLASGRLQ